MAGTANMLGRLRVQGCVGVCTVLLGCAGDAANGGAPAGGGAASDPTAGAPQSGAEAGASGDPAAGGAQSDAEAGAAGITPEGGNWPIEAGWQVVDLAVASSAGEGAVLIAESTNDAARIVLQRFTADGAQVGQPFELATLPGAGDGARVGLASNGDSYLACWSFLEALSCSAVSADDELSSDVFHGTGHAPALAHVGDTWLVAFATGTRGDPASFVLQPLATNWEPRAAASYPSSEVSTSYDPVPFLTATDAGFVLVAPNARAGYREHVYRLDQRLEPVTAPLDLGQSFWFYGAVAATQTQVAVSLSYPYGSYLIVADAASAVHQYTVGTLAKTGTALGLAARDSELFSAWLRPTGEVYAQAFVTGKEELGAADAAPTWLKVVTVSNRTLVVSMTSGSEFGLGTGLSIRPTSEF